MKDQTVKQMSIWAAATALVCMGTMIIQIPIPLGYAHLGDAVILLVSVFLGPGAGMVAGGLGSALVDLLSGYPQWVLVTLLTKAWMGFVVGTLAAGKTLWSVPTFLAVCAGLVSMVAGYFAGGAALTGSLAAGAAQIPGLTVKGIFAMALFYAAGTLLEKAQVRRVLGTMGRRK